MFSSEAILTVSVVLGLGTTFLVVAWVIRVVEDSFMAGPHIGVLDVDPPRREENIYGKWTCAKCGATQHGYKNICGACFTLKGDQQ